MNALVLRSVSNFWSYAILSGFFLLGVSLLSLLGDVIPSAFYFSTMIPLMYEGTIATLGQDQWKIYE